MATINLSYVITTYNKLPYLKEVMRLLLQNKKEDEEIVVADGGSTDGTGEFLSDLFKQGKIDQFISEKDKGEAHGYNKTFLMAKGTLVKIITDDDVYDYSAVNEMKAFMLSHPEFDALSGNIISVNIMSDPAGFELRKSYEVWFRQYKEGTISSCFFSCLPLMIRRERFPLLGLFDTSYKHVDLEYSVRLTAHRRKLAFYSGIVAIGIVNQQSVSAGAEAGAQVEAALKRLKGNYGFIDHRGIKSETIPVIKRKIINKWALLRKIENRLRLFKTKTEYYPVYDFNLKEIKGLPEMPLEKLFPYFENELLSLHEKKEFIY